MKKDPELEANKELMETLTVYCTERRLPAELQKKIRASFAFQQQHASSVSEHVVKVPSRLVLHMLTSVCGCPGYTFSGLRLLELLVVMLSNMHVT